MFITDNISKAIISEGNTSIIKLPFEDTKFSNFINDFSGSFFFENSLHIFSTNLNSPLNIQKINEEITSLYDISNISFFLFWGQDLFGNLFYYEDKGIGFFEIETGEKNLLSSNFSTFDSLLMNDYEYLTGVNYLKDWEFFNNKTLQETDRLCPKIPFIIGGDYAHDNLYEKDFFLNWRFNSDLAKQIKDTPDGSPVQIEIV
jgi:hypothetical protein